MNPLYFLPILPYLLIALFVFMWKADRWTNPWPWDKAFALGVFWLPSLIFVIIRAIVTGITKLVKDEVL